MRQEIITTAEQLHARFLGWLGRDFAFDVETSGLDPVTDRLVGVALTFAPDEHYYVALAHTVEEVRRVPTATTVNTLVGYEAAQRGDRYVQVPIFREEVVTEEREERIYPLRDFVDADVARVLLSALFSQTDVLMIAHNAKFDLHFLERYGIRVRGRLADTMLAAQLLDENRDVGLKSLASLVSMDLVSYKDLPHYPGFKIDEYLGVPLEEAARYAMRDTEATYRLWQRFRQELTDDALDAVFTDIWMPLLVVLQRMERRGVVIDLEKLRDLLARFERERQDLQDEIEREGLRMVLAMVERGDPRAAAYARLATPDEVAAAGNAGVIERHGLRVPLFRPTPRSNLRVYHFNPSSTQHVGDLLYGWYRLTVPQDMVRSEANGGRPVDKNTLKSLRLALGEACPPIIETLLRYREVSKLITTYFENFLRLAERDAEHAVRTTFNQHVTDSGRLSSSDPINLQNVPARGEYGKIVRDMFRARPGHTLIVADLSMAELRMLAHYSHDDTMREAFADGRDLHVLTGARQAGITYDDLMERIGAGDPEAKRIRQIGKTSNFCVPLDTLCLTRRGWKRYDEIVPNEDETVGFDPLTGRTRWTMIREVLTFDDAPLMRIGNRYWSAVATPDHRWYGYRVSPKGARRYERPGYYTTTEIGPNTTIIVAAPFVDAPAPTLLEEDARLIAWLWAASPQPTGETVAETLPRRFAIERQHAPTVSRLLAHLPHTKVPMARETLYEVDLRPLIERYDLDRHTPAALVASLSERLRSLMLDVVEKARSYPGFSASDSAVADAVRLLFYLDGHLPWTSADGCVYARTPRVTGQHLTREAVPSGPVWCVRTDLGTWTMRQGRYISLTGNSLMYGMGPKRYQAMLLLEQGIRVSLDEARRLIDEYNALYAGATAWKARVVQYARQVGYTRSIAGRKRRLPDLTSPDPNVARQAERIGVNFIIQGSVADLMATAMIAIDKALAPIGGRILLQVHDELVCEVPTEHADLAARIVSLYMSDYVNQRYRLRVPMVAEAHIGDTWYSAKDGR